jgi:hypothetical protein
MDPGPKPPWFCLSIAPSPFLWARDSLVNKSFCKFFLSRLVKEKSIRKKENKFTIFVIKKRESRAQVGQPALVTSPPSPPDAHAECMVNPNMPHNVYVFPNISSVYSHVFPLYIYTAYFYPLSFLHFSHIIYQRPHGPFPTKKTHIFPLLCIFLALLSL